MSPSGDRRVLTAQEEMAGFALRKLPTDESQPFGVYHDPKTGKTHKLPADPWSRWHYSLPSKSRPNGLKFGPPPTDQIFSDGNVPTVEDQHARRIAELEAELAALRGEEQPEAARQPVQLKML